MQEVLESLYKAADEELRIQTEIDELRAKMLELQDQLAKSQETVSDLNKQVFFQKMSEFIDSSLTPAYSAVKRSIMEKSIDKLQSAFDDYYNIASSIKQKRENEYFEFVEGEAKHVIKNPLFKETENEVRSDNE